jgi:peroxiredoxin Q/BCP
MIVLPPTTNRQPPTEQETSMQDFYEPKVGDVAPDFRLPSTRGKEISLRDFKGKDVILYFYPKDDTPGCTAEACSFRDHENDLTKEHAVVLGVSIDPLASHDKFTSKHNLNFPLLSDETADVAKMYGVWKEKNLYGRRTWGVARTTYWIGPDGRIRKIYKKVDAARHAEDILEDLRAAHKK